MPELISKIVSFSSSIMENIVVSSFPSWAWCLVKLIWCIALGSASSDVYLNLMLSSYKSHSPVK